MRSSTEAVNVGVAPWNGLSVERRDAVRGLAVTPEQAEFAGTVAASIAACEAGDPAHVCGLAILAGGDVAGFVVLKRGAALPLWAPGPDAVVVSALRIDVARQGLGLGTRALAALRAWVRAHWPEARTLMLRVDDGNGAGIRAYEKAGWVETGERVHGRVGIERTMVLPIAG